MQKRKGGVRMTPPFLSIVFKYSRSLPESGKADEAEAEKEHSRRLWSSNGGRNGSEPIEVRITSMRAIRIREG
jgi:hypothetical protein